VELRGTVLRCREETAADGSTRFVTGVQFVDDAVDEGIGGLIGRL
jgi:hypothetical protein